MRGSRYEWQGTRRVESIDRKSSRRRVATILLASILALSGAHATSPFRYDDDLSAYSGDASRDSLYAQLKYLPLDDDGQQFVSLGADFRERVESANVGLLGFRYSSGNTYVLQRALAYLDGHFDAFRVFVQLGNELQSGRKPAALPTDIDRTDIAQGFVDYRLTSGDGSIVDLVRFGRFEMSFDDGALIGLRDGPNIRQSWDGAHFIYSSSLFQFDAFDVSPVALRTGSFDDPSTADQRLWGGHAESKPGVLGPVIVTAFYYGSAMPTVALLPQPSAEFTRTLGTRIRAAGERVDGSLGAIAQTGHLGERAVRAWSAHADGGWTFADVLWSPRVGLRFDALSGGDNRGNVVHTFNALYPNYAFSTEATLEAPANLLQPGATMDLHIDPRVNLQYKIESLWRYSTKDAFYAAPLFPLVLPDATNNERFSGTEQQLRAAWSINPFVTVTAACVHFAPSTFLRSAHAMSENFGMTEISIRL